MSSESKSADTTDPDADPIEVLRHSKDPGELLRVIEGLTETEKIKYFHDGTLTVYLFFDTRRFKIEDIEDLKFLNKIIKLLINIPYNHEENLNIKFTEMVRNGEKMFSTFSDERFSDKKILLSIKLKNLLKQKTILRF